jgi:hypothetical protein
MKRLVSVFLIVTAAMAAPMVVPTRALARENVDATINVRISDPYRRDYGYWDSHERRAYDHYLAERHRTYLSYQRHRLAERRAYWHWRHEQEERWEHRR